MLLVNMSAIVLMYFLALAESKGPFREKAAAALLFVYNLALVLVSLKA